MQPDTQATPTKILLDKRVIQAACGEYHSLILTEQLELMSCGNNAYSALGHSETDQKKRCKKFVKIPTKLTGNISKITSGNRHNLLLTTDGKVHSWGCNKYGQLGYPTDDPQPTCLKR
jgi:alpha-tubulin suppressor-like RCC1 family protein